MDEMQPSVPQEVMDGIRFMFEIIGSEIGDRMDYMSAEEKAKIEIYKDKLLECQKDVEDRYKKISKKDIELLSRYHSSKEIEQEETIEIFDLIQERNQHAKAKHHAAMNVYQKAIQQQTKKA